MPMMTCKLSEALSRRDSSVEWVIGSTMTRRVFSTNPVPQLILIAYCQGPKIELQKNMRQNAKLLFQENV